MEKIHPPSTKIVIFQTIDGEEHHGFYVKDINKHITGVNRWKDANTEKWYDDKEISNWRYFKHYPDY